MESGFIEDTLSWVTNLVGGFAELIKSGKALPAILNTIVSVLAIMIGKTLALAAAKALVATANAASNGDGYTAAVRAAAVGTAILGVGATIAGAFGLNSSYTDIKNASDAASARRNANSSEINS